MDREYAEARLVGRFVMAVEWSEEFLRPVALVLDDGTRVVAEHDEGGLAPLKVEP